MAKNRAVRAAFTLIEVLVVVAIIALLVAILIPSLAQARELTRRASCKSNVRQMTMGMLFHATDDKNGVYIYTKKPTDDGMHFLYDRKYMPNVKTAICASTANIIDLSQVNASKPTEEIVDDNGRTIRTVKRYSHLIQAAENRHDSSGGHSYEIFAWFWGGIFPGGLRYDYDARITLRLTKKPSVQFILTDSDQDPWNNGLGGTSRGAWTFDNWPDDATNNHGQTGGNIGFLDGHVEWVNQRNWVPVFLKSAHINFPLEHAKKLYFPGLKKLPRKDGLDGKEWLLH